MKRFFSLLCTFCLCSCLLAATERPRVAVVLAGGGAKGLAHVGALKVLEETGIPIDIVVGNSMGSIVGGLYAIGYTPDEMDSVIRSTDWIKLILDTPDYDNKLLSARKMLERYQLRVALNPERQTNRGGRGGIIHGKNIESLLRNLTNTIPDSVDFNDLPIPFACNATEVLRGSVYEFHSGNLVQAMRSSMAIPGVFTPVDMDSMLFVDGFVTNNYPVDVAKRMGADIIIGCDLISTVPEAERYTNLMDLVTHMIDISSTHQYEENIRMSDIYIDIDATGYSSASFGEEDIDSLITRGERRARQMVPQILALKDQLQQQYGELDLAYIKAQQTRKSVKRQQDMIRLQMEEENRENYTGNFFRRIRKNYLNSSINLGARFDTDEYASVLLGANVNIPTRHHLSISIDGRLGMRSRGEIKITHHLPDNVHVGISYSAEHAELRYTHHGASVADVTDNHQCTRFFIGQTWQNVLYNFGLRYDWHYYSDMLVRNSVADLAPEMEGHKVRYLDYFASVEYNTQNSYYYPMRGTRLHGEASIITENLYQYDGGPGIPILSLSWSSAFTPGEWFTMIPHASGRIILSDDTKIPVALHNVLGGLAEGMKVEQQLLMAGVSSIEIFSENAVLAAGLGLQARIGKRHYIQGAVDGGSVGSQLNNNFSHKGFTWGTQLGYNYSSVAGPISLTAYWSERTKLFNLMLNMGYCF